MTSAQRIRLMALWGERWRRQKSAGSAEDSRDARLCYLASVCGRMIESANDLTEAEAARVISAIESELPKKVLPFPNRNRITPRQIWKIRQLEAHLRWSGQPERLAGFLRGKFKADTQEQLSFAQGWRAIEALFATAARTAIKRAKGEAYKVGAAELTAEIKRLKVELEGATVGFSEKDGTKCGGN